MDALSCDIPAVSLGLFGRRRNSWPDADRPTPLFQSKGDIAIMCPAYRSVSRDSIQPTWARSRRPNSWWAAFGLDGQRSGP
ncbi:uncharacterized protein BDW47DRAFT_107115 [Aspergillus candidus]|uniref:Uncharacterized protein n=1 Tax=Aspergillus candidus TaxID=41067 RepID=A0A2I2F9A3_ASPCN|nr:hypothetical protein BDW47DRAFT_107115 [Aspergillus candidus]PLB37203.1 hypothetical protein BDW47DRAFT_107115 [Aspergillus candidus]